MSIVSAGGKLGAAYYCPDTTVLYMMPDAAETDAYDILKKGQYSVNQGSVRVNACSNSKNVVMFFWILKNVKT